MKKTIHLFGAPFDIGANILGSRLGPGALRLAGLQPDLEELGHKVIEHGDAICSNMVTHECRVVTDFEQRVTTIEEICLQLAQLSYSAIKRGGIPLMVGGDHSFAIGSISGISAALREKNQKTGVIWFDAHADVNTPETSGSSNIHGMPLATLLGFGVDRLCNIMFEGAKIAPKNVVLIGLRSVDEGERAFCQEKGLHYYSMRDVDELGIREITKRAIAAATDGTDGIHVSLDIDGVDPIYAPGVSTPVPGGLSYRETHLALEMIAETGKLVGFDAVELNPVYDQKSQTAQTLKEFILSGFGKTILGPVRF